MRKLTKHEESVIRMMGWYLDKLFAVDNGKLVIANQDNFDYWLKRVNSEKWSEFIDILKEFGLTNGD